MFIRYINIKKKTHLCSSQVFWLYFIKVFVDKVLYENFTYTAKIKN